MTLANALPDPLTGRVAIVTGASSGIGVAVATALAGLGATVVLAARRVDRLEQLQARIEAAGGRAEAVGFDALDPAASQRLVADTVAAHGRLDILVNNAGVMLLGPVAETDVDEWEHMITLNTVVPMRLTKAALPHLLETRGSIVQMSSIAGRTAMPGAAAYCASKFALNAFSDSLRQEVTGRGVRVTMIEPGTVETELRGHISHTASREAIEARAGAMRQLQAQDVADAVVHAVTAPAHVAIAEILLRPVDQA